ncbi:hypothetical protein [Nocardia carnea]|uniref:hypothetical protein n=1 Tax=Nocardia carnea TaxID=37328 RepID=UPI0024564002|nr:hypothetical protein [Nocardia carnea]
MLSQRQGGDDALYRFTIDTIDTITEHQPTPEMAQTHTAEYQTLTQQPGFIAYQLTKPTPTDSARQHQRTRCQNAAWANPP